MASLVLLVLDHAIDFCVTWSRGNDRLPEEGVVVGRGHSPILSFLLFD